MVELRIHDYFQCLIFILLHVKWLVYFENINFQNRRCFMQYPECLSLKNPDKKIEIFCDRWKYYVTSIYTCILSNVPWLTLSHSSLRNIGATIFKAIITFAVRIMKFWWFFSTVKYKVGKIILHKSVNQYEVTQILYFSQCT